jgi:DNA polymerase I
VDKPQKSRPRLYLIDGYALIYRAFFALIARPLISARGENTSAAWGVTKFLIKVLEQHEPDYLGIVFDAGSSDRHLIYPEYKATRQKMPSELEASLPRVRSIVEAFRIPVLELAGYEADDVIGTLAMRAVEQGLEAVIVSGDKDFYQLIRPHICLLNPGRGGPQAVDEEWVDTRNAHERLGVPPEHVVDYLGLIGDSSDNVPGVPGIGPKTAIQLIQEYGTVEQLIERAGEIKAKRPRESLQAFGDAALLSKQLVTIRTDLDVPLDLDALVLKTPDRAKLKEILLELEFNSLVRDWAAPGAEERRAAERPAGTYLPVDDPAELRALVERIRAAGRVAIDTKTGVRDPMRGEPVGISLSYQANQGFYLPIAHRGSSQGEMLLDTPTDAVRNLPPLDSPEMRPLVELLEDASVRKVAMSLKQELLVYRRAGITLRGLDFDVLIGAYLLEPGRRDLTIDELSVKHLDHRTTSFEEVCGKGKAEIPYAEVPLEAACAYAAEDADVALQLADHFAPELQRLHLDGLLRDMELPLIHALAEMEWTGIRIDEPFFARMNEELLSQLRQVEGEIFAEAGQEFQINSNNQLREILFGKLGLPVIKRTKTGASTDVDVLQALADQGHHLPTLLMKYRQLEKLRSTYTEMLPRMVNPATGRIHTSYSQTVAATGRLSSSDPNLQNIPIRTEMGAEIRRGFVPAEGNRFVSLDYSQIELRFMAHYSQDPAFLEAFRNDVDIHQQTAGIIFGVAPDQVTKDMRAQAKTTNFSIIYGVGPYTLAQRLGIPVADAKVFIEQYFERFPRVRSYLDEQIEFGRRHGYVETITGRRRYIPEIASRNFNVRSFGERAATNAPIQGSSADLIKLAMINIHDDLERAGLPGRMLLQVHDELLFEVPAEHAEALVERVRERMEHAMELSVPLRVEAGTGTNWLEAK